MKKCLYKALGRVGDVIVGSLGNLWSGFQLLLFMPRKAKDFSLAPVYLWSTALILAVTYITADYIYIRHPDNFDRYPLEGLALYFVALLVGAFIASAITGRRHLQWSLPIVALNTVWVPILADYVIGYLFEDAMKVKADYRSYQKLQYLVMFWAAFRSAMILIPKDALRQLAAAMAVLGAVILVNETFYTNPFWYKNYVEEQRKEPELMPEDVLSDQSALLADQLSKITPRKKGRNYFVVTVGSEDEQNVFMKEAIYARGVFEKHFNAVGHVITLINNRAMLAPLPEAPVKSIGQVFDYLASKTAAAMAKKSGASDVRYPLATVTNLSSALQAIGKKADMNEDVLLLYITSHGGKNNTISVGLSGMELYQLTGDKLRKMIGQSGFKWKVIMISACYSGSFVDKLKDDTTIIMTSSREDRFSYGCGEDYELTFFGDALLREALGKTDSFINAFELARESIEHHEEADGIRKHSQPQLYVGIKAKEYLK